MSIQVLGRQIGIACRQSRSAAATNVIRRRLSSSQDNSDDELLVQKKDQILWVKFNRPKQLNAISRDMYDRMCQTFTDANTDDSIKAVLLTGSGSYYSSGNDLKNFVHALKHKDGPKAGFVECKDLLQKFVESLINLEKFLIAVVNGPAIGIPVTTLPLADYVIASDAATFQTPFTSLGQCPEACSSITFPKIMGSSRANEILALNQVWDAHKAHRYGLVSEVVQSDKLEDHINSFLYDPKKGLVASCYPQSLRVGKSLMRNVSIKRQLSEANKNECDAILKCWVGPECTDALQKFFQRSKKQ